MSVLNTQSVLSQRLDEKEQKQNASIELAPNYAPQIPELINTPANEQNEQTPQRTSAPFSSAEFNAHKEFLRNSQRQSTKSDDYTPEQVEFAIAFSKESDELLKQGASKKKMVDFLRTQDILDAQSWAILDKESGGDDELLFDFLKQNADRVRNTENGLQTTDYGTRNAEDGLQNTENGLQNTENGLRNTEDTEGKFKNLKDLSALEKEFHNPTFKTWLETFIKQGAQRASSIVIGTDEWLKNDADKDIAFNIREKIQQGAKKEDFTPLEKWYMSNEMQNINWQRASAITDTSEFSLKNRKQSIKASLETDDNALFEQNYKERKALESAMKKKNRADLNEEEARAYERYAGINTLFGDENDEFERQKQLYNAEFVVVPQMQKQLAFLKNIHENESFSNQLLFKDEKLKKQYENDLVDFALNLGFDGVAKDDKNGDTYFIKEGKEYLVNEGFFDNFINVLDANKGAIASGIAGGIAGAKKGGVKGSIIGAAAGSFFGAGADTLLTNYMLDRENSANELIRHSVEEGLLSVATDAAVIGLGKGIKYLAQNNKKLVEQGKTALNWIGDNTFLLGAARNLKTQNLRGAESIVAMDSELKKGIDEAYELYGGRVGIDETHFLQGGADKIKAKFGENSTEAKLAQGLADIVNLRNLKDRQNALVEYIRADESGRALGFLVEVASRSPIVQQNLKIILNKTSADLTQKLEKLGIHKADIKKVYDDLEQATEASYDEAMDGILAKLYPKDIEKYRASIDTQPFEDLIAQFKDEKTLIDDVSKIFKKDIIDALFSGEKLSFTQLNNIRKNLNLYTRNLLEKRPSFQNTLTLQLQKELRNAIDNAIKDIFRQNPVAFGKASELYETALKDYANMKNTLKVIDELKASNAKTWEENAVKALINFAKGQGDDITNLARLTRHLEPENRAVVEMNILQQLFEKSRFIDDMTNIDVFDSTKFLEKLSKLTGKEGEKAVFESAQAKELIKMVNDFHTLFKKDADIARHLSPARTNNPTGTPNMATSMQGKVNMTRIKLLWEYAIRNMPDMFWLPKTWREGIKGAALRYHLHHALSRSGSISEFKQNFSEAVKRIPHTTQAQKVIKEMNKAFDEMENLSKDLAKMSDDELIKKEMKDTFGVVYNGENSALIYKDLQNIQNAILLQKGDKNKGATHIRLKHTLDNNQQGFVMPDEVQNIGQNVRKYLKEHKEPFIDADGARLYEWQDEKGVNFRLVVRDNVSGADTLPTSANEEIITFYSNRNLKDDTNFSFKNPQVAQSAQNQAPANKAQKSLLDLAREETQRLKQAQIDKELAQKEAEIARLKEMKAQQEQIIAQKESKAGLSANEAQRLEIGSAIPTKLLKPTKIIISDSAQPFEAEFVIAKKSDIKPNFERTLTQGRSEKQNKVIEDIQKDFKPHLIFEQSGGFEGLPIITKDGQVIAGNHRAEAINALSGEQLARYKQAAKEKFSVDLADDEVIVRLVNDENEKDLINLAFMSNVGRESNLGEKALSNLAKFEKEMSNLPNHIEAQSVDELQNIIAKTLDKQGAGLNTFDTNLALFSKLAKNSKNNDILDALNQIQNLSAEEKSKILKMFVDNAGAFYNIAKDADLKNLDLRAYLNDSLVVAAKSYATRAEDYARLLGDIEHILSLSEAGLKETLALDKNLFENLKSKALGLSLARFARLENPSAQLFEFLKNAKNNLEDLNSANLFDSRGKKLDELDIYDFLKHSIAQGRESEDALKIISKLDEIRAVEDNIVFAKGRKKDESVPSLFSNEDLTGIKASKEIDLSQRGGADELRDFFRVNNKDKINAEIFEKTINVAQKLGVRVRFSASVERSSFEMDKNLITIAAGNAEHFQAQDLLHELIHSATRKGFKLYKENKHRAKMFYTQRQIEAFEEIESLYTKSKQIAQKQGQTDIYAHQSVDEFVAELSSSEFRKVLKAQDLFEKVIRAIVRFFYGEGKDFAGVVSKNSFEELKKAYYKILDEYEPPLAPKNQKRAEVEKIQSKIGDLKAQKNELLAQMQPPVTEAVRNEIKEKAKNINKEIERNFFQIKLTEKIGRLNLTADILEQAQKDNKRIIVDKLDSAQAQKLGFDEPEFVVQSIDGQAINHTLKRHGVGSELVQNGQPPIMLDDIAMYPSFVNVAQETLQSVSDRNMPTRISFNQINGYYVVVEEVHNGQGELAFKTMYKGNGDFKNSNAYKQAQQRASRLKLPDYRANEARGVVNIADKEIIPNSNAKSQILANDEFKLKTPKDYENEYMQRLKAQNPNLSDDELADKVKLQKDLANAKMDSAKSLARLNYGYGGLPQRTDKELENIFDDGFTSLATSRKIIEDYYNIQPLKEFGKNYAEFYHDGANAVKKLLFEAQSAEKTGEKYSGQVAGAFWRKELGDIDLVFGDENMGLSHILKKHGDEFTHFKGDTQAEKIANALNEIVENGKIAERNGQGGVNIEYKGYIIGLNKGFDGVGNNKWIVTAFDETIPAAEKTAKTALADDFTKETLSKNSANDIIPNPSAKSQILDKINEDIQAKVKRYTDISNEMKEINARRIELGNSGFSYTQKEKLKRLEKQLKPIEREVRRLETLHKYYDIGTLKDFVANIDPQSREWYEKAIEKYEKSVAKSSAKSDTFANKEALQSVDNAKNKAVLVNDENLFHNVSQVNQKDDIILPNSTQRGENGERSDKLNTAQSKLQGASGERISAGLFDEKELYEPQRVRGGDIQPSAENGQHTQTIPPQKQERADTSGGLRGDTRTDGGAIRGDVSNMQNSGRHNVRKRLEYARSGGFDDNAKPTQRGDRASNGNATDNTQSIISTDNPAGLLNPAEKALIDNQKFTAKTLHPALQTIKEYYESELESVNKFIKECQTKLNRLKADEKFATTNDKQVIAEYSADLAKAMKEKTSYKKELQQLARIEPLLKTAEKRLGEFAKNPNAKDLKAIYKLKNQLLSVESDLKPAFLGDITKEHGAMLNKVADMLDLAFESIRTAKESLAVKQADPKALTPTQAFLDFVDDTKRQIDYALSFGKYTTLKTLDEIAKDYANSNPHLNFIKRKKAEVEAYFKGDESASQASNGAQATRMLDKAVEIVTTKENTPIAKLRANAKEKLDILVEQKIQITNKNDGRVAQISGEGRKKILSGQAVKKTADNGLPREAHFEASGRIKELYENSVFDASEPPRNNSRDIKAVHKYIANVNVNGKGAQALLTLKENASNKIGNRIYSLELQELRPLPNAQARTKQAQQGQSHLTLAGDTSAKSTPEVIEKIDSEIISKENSKSQIKNKKEIIARKIDIVDEFEEKQFTLWNSELHKELKNLQDEIDKTLGKNLGLHSADLSDSKITNAVSALRYDVFAKLFNEAKLPYESCKKLKGIIKKGKEVDFNDKELSSALNKFENPLLFIQNYANTKLPAPFRDNLFQKIEKVFKNVERKSQENIKEFKKALNSGDKMSSENLDKGQKMHSNIISDDKINYTYLKDIAQELKEIKNEAEFYALFGFKNGKTRGNVKTPIKEVEIDLKEAWQHLQDNSKKENRLKLAGGILPTLQTPNVVSVDKNGTYFFYKAFKDEKGVLNLVSIELPKSNRLQYKTSYIASKQRLLKIFNEYEVIYKNL